MLVLTTLLLLTTNVKLFDRRKAYLARATKIKQNWKDDPYSKNNLSINLLWM